MKPKENLVMSAMRRRDISAAVATAVLLICNTYAAGNSDVVEILDLHVPVESSQQCLELQCPEPGVFVMCKGLYAPADGRLSKLVLIATNSLDMPIMGQNRQLLAWISDQMLPHEGKASTSACYAAGTVSNSWGEVVQVVSTGSNAVLTVSNIAIDRRLKVGRETGIRFPKVLMGVCLAQKLDGMQETAGEESVFYGENKGLYAFYRSEFRQDGGGLGFFDNGSCSLSFATKTIMSVKFTKVFDETSRERVIDDFLHLVRLKHQCDGIVVRSNPVSGDRYAGTGGVCENGIGVWFHVNRKEGTSKSLLTVYFKLPQDSYLALLSEGRK